MSPTPVPVESHGEVRAVSWRKVFTGREAELRLLGELMLSSGRGCFVVWLHGVAGVGKSTLLRRFAEEAEAHGRITRSVDLRHADPTPEAFLAALEAQGAPQDAQVLLIDSAESLGPLEQWLRDVFLPGMPTPPLLVVGCRLPPSAEWRTDPQWWHALRSVELTGMDEAEAALLLRNRDVDEADVPGIVRAAHGLPLALALFADARALRTGSPEPGCSWELRDCPDLVGELLRLMLRESPSLARTDALHVLALARVTTEESVRHALEVTPAEARALCTWLRGLSFVRSTAEGLVPHELVREALLADLRWRGPQKYESLFGRLHSQLVERLGQRAGDRWASGAGLACLGRASRVAREAVDWRGADRMRLRAARPEDLDEVVAAIEKEHGVAAGALARSWWQYQQAAFTVAEDGRRLVGVLVAPCLEPSATGLPDDPVARAALKHMAGRSPLRRTERLLLTRWSTGSAAAACSALMTLWATTPGLAMSWTCTAGEQSELASLLDLYGQQRTAPVEGPDGEPVLPFVQDWRCVPFDRWAAALRVRLLSDEPAGAVAPAAAVVEPAMPWGEFADAVKHAYRSAGDPRRLGESALLGTRLVAPGADATALREVLTQTVSQLRAHPGQRQLGDVLEITYLGGPRSQQAAASRVAMSFSTYRRRLSTALTKAAELLRDRELYGPVPR
ncbi:AAA family ATPase [Streptomyces erythrochromogenes]|uniref:AAA family ATPase n=1 Tax=Streptomyces erythrochromogenes TaxID=285574 RepID=UPI00368E9EF5